MISSQTHQISPPADELISESDADYRSSGLKRASVIRARRLAVVQEDILAGAIGEIGKDRLTRIRDNLAKWIAGSQPRGVANSGSAPVPPE
jgi:mRNA interferase MazF